MGVNRKDINIDYASGSPVFNPSPGSTALYETDTLKVNLSGFPANSEISEIKFYSGSPKTEANHLGNWTRPQNKNDPALTGKFRVTSGLLTQVVVEDTEKPADDKHYWFSVVMKYNGTESFLDPEIINKKGKG